MTKLNIKTLVAAGLTILPLIGTAALFAGCKSNDATSHGSDHVHQYTCPHHPEVKQTAAGNCPKCGMKLVHEN